MAGVSLLLFWSRFRRAQISLGLKRIRMFKHEVRSVPLEVGHGGSRWVRLTSVALEERPGLVGTIKEAPSGTTELVLRPSLAGSSSELRAILRASDILGLFTKVRTVRLEFVLDVLPLALRERAPSLTIALLSFGENPAGASGSGQELYAVSQYQSGLDPRDIMWKRAAGMTDESIPVRVREANVRKVVSIGISVQSRSAEETARMADLIAEAVARIGVRALPLGTALEIRYAWRSLAHRVVVSNLRELADASGLRWAEDDGRSALQVPSQGSFDLVIVGPSDSTRPGTKAPPPSRWLLILSDAAAPRYVPQHAIVFTGREDLADLTTSVMAG